MNTSKLLGLAAIVVGVGGVLYLGRSLAATETVDRPRLEPAPTPPASAQPRLTRTPPRGPFRVKGLTQQGNLPLMSEDAALAAARAERTRQREARAAERAAMIEAKYGPGVAPVR